MIIRTDKEVLAFLKRQFPKMNLKKLSKKDKQAMIRSYWSTEAELARLARRGYK